MQRPERDRRLGNEIGRCGGHPLSPSRRGAVRGTLEGKVLRGRASALKSKRLLSFLVR